MRQKYIFIKLALLLVVAPPVLWFGALSKTTRLYLNYRTMGKVADTAQEDAPGVDWSGIFTQDLVSDGQILSEIENQYKGVYVYSFTPKTEKEEAGLSMVKASMELKGDFKSLLKALHMLEMDGRFALSDIAFERKEERETLVTLKLTINQLIRDE